VVAQEPIEVAPNSENRRYLEAKREKLGHKLHHQDLRFDPELYDGAEA
jgi:3,4-dihydroxy 2-butanone 4-phosphate synthase/GTP cyclohydrolase II